MEKLEEFIFEEKSKEGEWFEGQCIEDIAEKKYSKIHKFTSKIKHENSWYDLLIPELNNIGIECKYDMKGFKTKRICIEVGQDGRDSGLRLTKSKYYIIYDDELMYLILTEDIKKLIRKHYVYEYNKYMKDLDYVTDFGGILYHKDFEVGQGTYSKKMEWYLIPRKLFIQYCLEVGDFRKLTYEKLI